MAEVIHPKVKDINPLNRSEDKDKALAQAMALVNRKFGKGAIMRLGERQVTEVDVISTGSLCIDLAIGIGGLPKGRIIEIYGHESSGKTTLALSVIAQCQRNGGACAFIDAEHAFDSAYAKKLGVDTNNLLISQPDSGEQALEIADILTRSGNVDVIVIDSVAALVPQAELDGTMENISVGSQARLMSRALRKMAALASQSSCMLIFINQIRMKISSGPYGGNPETTTGGNALKFFASVRIEVRKIRYITKNDSAIGIETAVKIVKNKMAPPFKKVEVEIMFDHGISKAGEIISLAEKAGIINKSGSWYSYEGENVGQGREGVRKYLLENPEIMTKIEHALRAKSESINLEDSPNGNPSEEEILSDS